MTEGTGQDGAGGRAAHAWRHRVRAPVGLDPFGCQAVVGDKVNELAIETEDRAESADAQAERVSSNHLEHRLGVRGRARDDSENLAGGGLLLQGLGEVAVPGLELLEEADDLISGR